MKANECAMAKIATKMINLVVETMLALVVVERTEWLIASNPALIYTPRRPIGMRLMNALHLLR